MKVWWSETGLLLAHESLERNARAFKRHRCLVRLDMSCPTVWQVGGMNHQLQELA